MEGCPHCVCCGGPGDMLLYWLPLSIRDTVPISWLMIVCLFLLCCILYFVSVLFCIILVLLVFVSCFGVKRYVKCHFFIMSFLSFTFDKCSARQNCMLLQNPINKVKYYTDLFAANFSSLVWLCDELSGACFCLINYYAQADNRQMGIKLFWIWSGKVMWENWY